VERAVKFALVAGGVSLLVAVVGGAMAGPDGRPAVWMGAGVAFVIQWVLFTVLFVAAFAARPLVAHGVGILGRLLAVGAAALFWVPWAGVPAAPFLLALVAVFFMTTLVEPLVLSGFPRLIECS
jgi:hypothetical protein